MAIAAGSTRATTPISVSAVGKPTALTAENYKFLQQEIYRESGIVLDEDKHYLLESRLTSVAREAQLNTLDELCVRLRGRAHPQLATKVIEALTTNETFFFRDSAPFEALRSKAIPELLEKRKTQKLAIWSAAASSGQEAYSIAMVAREMGLGGTAVDILGTDLSEQVLERAREARYVQFEVNRGLPAAYLVKYFQRAGIDWQLKEDVRKMVRFQRFDLRRAMGGLGRFDIIFCRNVLIYFDVPTKLKILEQLLNVMNSGGYLVLGGAETTLTLQGDFERVVVGSTSMYRKG